MKRYEYDYTLTKPSTSETLNYSDGIIEVDFTVNRADISFKIENLTDKPIKIMWDEASFVKNGEAQKTIHKNVKFIDKEKTQPPTVVPPGSFINDVIQPIDDIRFNHVTYGKYTSSYWSSEPLFPVNFNYNRSEKRQMDALRDLKGKKLNVYLPIVYEGKVNDYYFEFEITDISIRYSKLDKI